MVIDQICSIVYEFLVNRFLGNPVVKRFLGNPVVKRFLGDPVVKRFLGNLVVNRFLGNPVVKRRKNKKEKYDSLHSSIILLFKITTPGLVEQRNLICLRC